MSIHQPAKEYSVMLRPEKGLGFYVTEGEHGATLAGPFDTSAEANLWVKNRIAATTPAPQAPGNPFTPQVKAFEAGASLNDNEPTLDPLVKLIRSMKTIRQAALEETPAGKEELVDAALDVAATFIIGIYQQGQHLERISHALIAQTHLLAAVYSSADSPEETARHVAAAKDEMDASLAKMG